MAQRLVRDEPASVAVTMLLLGVSSAGRGGAYMHYVFDAFDRESGSVGIEDEIGILAGFAGRGV